jgi:hypothetical protein
MVVMIQQKRIFNLSLHLPETLRGSAVVCAIRLTDRVLDRLEKVGFSPKPADGESVLPGVMGPVTRFNAEGRWFRHTDHPMETAYRTVTWHWTEFHGKDRIERSSFKDVPYKRYPRTFIEPPSVELSVERDGHGARIVRTPSLVYSEPDQQNLLHNINLFLEIFGECEVLDDRLTAIAPAPTQRLNWQILPKGRMPWPQLRAALAPAIERARVGSRAFLEHRFRVLHDHCPDFQAVGTAGFAGYVIFGFPQFKLYVCESAQYGNATYVFAENWATLSQMTKAEILNGHLEIERVVHLSDWQNRIGRLFAASAAHPAA